MASLSLEQLMDITITSVSKKEENRFQSAAAVYVLTREDIRRLGVTSIPEALRRVPGVQVAQFNANIWAVTARGFNGVFSNKLLVLIDGRSVYNNLFGGVYWDVQDTPLEDIERIEVIRGPGGTIWGENAVNGVINIITKNSRDSQGGLVSAGGGTQENGFNVLRYGGKIGENANYRVYGKYFNRSDFPNTAGVDQNDQWEQGQGGFRTDWNPSDRNQFTLQGQYYQGQSSQAQVATRLFPPGNPTIINDVELSGSHLIGRWQHAFSPTSKLKVQTYFDYTHRKDAVIFQDFHTWDTEIQHDLKLFDSHEFSWGVHSRLIHDDLGSTSTIIANPRAQTNHIAGFFLQNTSHLLPDELRLIYGSKFGWNSFTGFEVQPNARVAWTPDHRHTLWAAASHAVRIPNRFLTSVRTDFAASAITGGTRVFSILPNPNQEAENLDSLELGYRQQVNSSFQWDIAFFFNHYTDLSTSENFGTLTQGAPPNLLVAVATKNANKARGEAFGVELAADWKPLDWWTIKSSFTWLDIQIMKDQDSTDTFRETKEGSSPTFQASMSSQIDLPYNLELDSHFYFVDELPSLAIPEYFRMDLRLGWHPIESLQLSLSIQNLTDNLHPEFRDNTQGQNPSAIPRSAIGQIIWTFE